jgi:hypothetical protein
MLDLLPPLGLKLESNLGHITWAIERVIKET